jgi:hypothetical protein
MSKHAAPWEDVTGENLEAERVAANWKRTNGSAIPGNGRRRKPSIMSALFRRNAA